VSGPASRWQQAASAVAWAAVLVLVYLGLKYVVPYFVPFLVALALAVFIDPTVNALEERLHLPRGWAVAVTLLFFLGLVVGLVLFGLGVVIVQLGELASNLPSHYMKLVAFSEDLLDRLTEVYSGLPEEFVAFIDTSVRASLDSVYTWLDAVVKAVLNGLKRLPSAFLVLAVSLVATFFLSRDKDLIVEFGLSLLPQAWRRRALAVNRDVLGSVVGLVKAQLALVALTAAVTVFTLYLLGVRYAWLVGLLTGILDVLPVVGPATVLVPWSVYCLISGNTFLGTGLAVLYVGISVFRQVMEPKIVGERIGLHPLATLLSLYLGVRLLGPGGLVIGPLVAIIVKAVAVSGRPPSGGGATPPWGRRHTGRPKAAAGQEGER